jgi:hypothetical protein
VTLLAKKVGSQSENRRIEGLTSISGLLVQILGTGEHFRESIILEIAMFLDDRLSPAF